MTLAWAERGTSRRDKQALSTWAKDAQVDVRSIPITAVGRSAPAWCTSLRTKPGAITRDERVS